MTDHDDAQQFTCTGFLLKIFFALNYKFQESKTNQEIKALQFDLDGTVSIACHNSHQKIRLVNNDAHFTALSTHFVWEFKVKTLEKSKSIMQSMVL